MPDVADAQLIEAAVGGEEDAFAELVGRYQAAVWGTVHRTLGGSSEREDAVQEIFMRAFVSLPKFDRRYPFGPWVLRIASNYCIDQLRRRRTRKTKLWSDLSEPEMGHLVKTMASEAEAESLATEDPSRYLEVARSLLDQLKPKHRMAFILKELGGHSYEAVAAIMGISEVNARVRVCRARADLHRAFRKYLSAAVQEDGNEESVRVV